MFCHLGKVWWQGRKREIEWGRGVHGLMEGWGRRRGRNSGGNTVVKVVTSHRLFLHALHRLQNHALKFVLTVLQQGIMAILALLQSLELIGEKANVVFLSIQTSLSSGFYSSLSLPHGKSNQ